MNKNKPEIRISNEPWAYGVIVGASFFLAVLIIIAVTRW